MYDAAITHGEIVDWLYMFLCIHFWLTVTLNKTRRLTLGCGAEQWKLFCPNTQRLFWVCWPTAMHTSPHYIDLVRKPLKCQPQSKSQIRSYGFTIREYGLTNLVLIYIIVPFGCCLKKKLRRNSQEDGALCRRNATHKTNQKLMMNKHPMAKMFAVSAANNTGFDLACRQRACSVV